MIEEAAALASFAMAAIAGVFGRRDRGKQDRGQAGDRRGKRRPQQHATGPSHWLPLTSCPKWQRACLRCMEVDHCLVHRLTELGLTPGVELQVVQDGGPMLVSVRGSRVALGRELADNVWVELHPLHPEAGADR